MNLLKKFLLFFIMTLGIGFGLTACRYDKASNSNGMGRKTIEPEISYRLADGEESYGFSLTCSTPEVEINKKVDLTFTVSWTNEPANLSLIKVGRYVDNNGTFSPLNGKNRTWTEINAREESKTSKIYILLYDGEEQANCTVSFVPAEKTAFDWMLGIVDSSLSKTLGATALLAILARTILSVYKKGQGDKKLLVTKDEHKKFEDNVKRDMRGYAEQIQKAVTDTVMRVIDKELKNIDDVSETAVQMRILKASIESELKNVSEKYDEIKTIGDSVRSLNNKITRIEYGQENGSERRSEK